VDSGDEASALTSPPSLAVSKSDSIDIDCAIEELDPQSGSSSLSYGSRYSFNEESMLEVLDNDDGDEDYDSLEDEDGSAMDAAEPLVSGRRRRQRRRWDDSENNKERSLLEVSRVMKHG
jgi:hypothetical protein